MHEYCYCAGIDPVRLRARGIGHDMSTVDFNVMSAATVWGRKPRGQQTIENEIL